MPYFPDKNKPITDFNPLPGTNLEWSFSLEETTIDYFFKNTQQVIADKTLTIEVPDYNALFPPGVYEHFKLSASPTTPSTPPEISINLDLQNGVIITDTNTTFTETIAYSNLEAVSYPYSNGSIRYERKYSVLGYRIDTEEYEEIESYIRNYVVQIVSSQQVFISPNFKKIFHIAGEASRPEYDVSVYSIDPYLVSIHEDFEIIGNNLPAPIMFFGKTVYPFQNSVDFKVKLKASADAYVDVLRENEIIVGALIGGNGGSNIIAEPFKADIFVASSLEYIYEPQTFSFISFIGQGNPQPQTLSLIGAGPWQIEAPSWLQLSSYSGTGGELIEVSLIDQSYFSEAFYSDYIKLTANQIVYEIPVLLKVVKRFNLNLSRSGLNYTDDNTLFTEIYDENENKNYARVEVSIPQIGYPDAYTAAKTYNYALGFYKNKTKIHFGEIVKRALVHLNVNNVYDLLQSYINHGTITTDLLSYYKPSLLKIKLEVLKKEDDTPVDEVEYNLIRFITGRNPKFKEKLALLRQKNVTQKVTKQSVRLVNFVTREKVALEVYKNGELHKSYIKDIKAERLYGLMASFDEYDEGDLIEYRLHPRYINNDKVRVDPNPIIARINWYQKLSFIVYPESQFQNQVIYEDEYRVPQIFDFCGAWMFESQNELIQSKKYTNLVEAIQNEKSIKKYELTMNTGYIPADNQLFVEQVSNSRLCWLIGNDTEKIIELVPKEYKMINYDAQLELYEYEVKFQINPTNDLQSYS